MVSLSCDCNLAGVETIPSFAQPVGGRAVTLPKGLLRFDIIANMYL
jgi:hypothetical protein